MSRKTDMKEFIKFCQEYPEMRPAQALLAYLGTQKEWKNHGYLLLSTHFEHGMLNQTFMRKEKVDIVDTFHIVN